MLKTQLIRFFLVLLGFIPGILVAQNTSSVFSPDVTAGKSTFEYRATYDEDSTDFAHRIHFQRGFSDSWRQRLILLQSEKGDGDLEFRYARWEGLWQFLEDETAGWDAALRFELQLADFDDLPSRFRVAWTGKVDLDEEWQLRGNFLTGHQFGEQSNGGYLLEARAQISRKLSDKYRIGVDYFGDLNTTDDLGSFDEQEHQFGPLLKFKSGMWSGLIGPLFGVSDGAPDTEWRIHLIGSF